MNDGEGVGGEKQTWRKQEEKDAWEVFEQDGIKKEGDWEEDGADGRRRKKTMKRNQEKEKQTLASCIRMKGKGGRQ